MRKSLSSLLLLVLLCQVDMVDQHEIVPDSQLPCSPPPPLFLALHTCILQKDARMTSPDSGHVIVGVTVDDTANSRD